MATRGRPSTKEAAKALGPDRVPENQKREVYERVRRAVEAKGGVCTQHKVGSVPWDDAEQKVLEEGLRYYPHERHSNMLIYIRIAAGLPKKTVRDVAHHLRHMQDVQRAKEEAAALHPAKRHHPDPAAAAAMAAMHEHQMAAMYAASAAGGMATLHALPGLTQSMSGPGGPGPHLKDEKIETRVCTLLQENMGLINSIRENVLMGRFFDNHGLMLTFDKNVKEVVALLATLPMGNMQKLPVQVNPYFITGSPPYMSVPAPPIPQRHHPHPQPRPQSHPPPPSMVAATFGGGPVPPGFFHSKGLGGPTGGPHGGSSNSHPAVPYNPLPPAPVPTAQPQQKTGEPDALAAAMRSGDLGAPPLPGGKAATAEETGDAGLGETALVAPTAEATPTTTPIPTPTLAAMTKKAVEEPGMPTGATAAAAVAMAPAAEVAAATATEVVPSALPPPA